MIRKILSITLIAVFAMAISINGFAQETLKKVAERGELRVGMTANQPPFTMKAKDGSVIGYEADLANMLAAAMGVKLTIVETPFPELLNALISGKVDVVMSGMTMTFERNMKVAFAGPYLLSGKSILTKSPALDYHTTSCQPSYPKRILKSSKLLLFSLSESKRFSMKPSKQSHGLKSCWRISRQHLSPTAATCWSTSRPS